MKRTPRKSFLERGIIPSPRKEQGEGPSAAAVEATSEREVRLDAPLPRIRRQSPGGTLYRLLSRKSYASLSKAEKEAYWRDPDPLTDSHDSMDLGNSSEEEALTLADLLEGSVEDSDDTEGNTASKGPSFEEVLAAFKKTKGLWDDKPADSRSGTSQMAAAGERPYESDPSVYARGVNAMLSHYGVSPWQKSSAAQVLAAKLCCESKGPPDVKELEQLGADQVNLAQALMMASNFVVDHCTAALQKHPEEARLEKKLYKRWVRFPGTEQQASKLPLYLLHSSLADCLKDASRL